MVIASPMLLLRGEPLLCRYNTFKDELFDEFTIKHSRFICYGNHVESKYEAENYVKLIRAKHWDAKHNVYAYCIKEGNIEKSSDDGEPQGTAGVPVLNRLKDLGLKDVVVVVTRYFGGVLLGKAGLSRAYSQGAYKAAEACGVIKMRKHLIVCIKVSYNICEKLRGIIINSGAILFDCIYTEFVEMKFYLEEKKLDFVSDLINKISGGQADVIVNGEKYCAIVDKCN